MNALFDRLDRDPVWVLGAMYVLFALICAESVRRLTRRWLTDLAASRTGLDPEESNIATEILVATMPRPIGGATFLAMIAIGVRWLPLSQKLSSETRRLLPFSVGILVALAAMRIAFRAIDAYGRSNPTLKSTAGIGRGITWVIGIALVAVLASDAIGISLAPALTALGVGSLAVALALQDTLSNFFAGVSLVVDKPIRIGEFVRLDGGQEGYVDAIGWRSTRLRTMSGGYVVVPNATLAKAVLTNFRDQNPRLFVDTRIDVALDVDTDHVLSLLESEASSLDQIKGAQSTPAPYVRFAPGVTDTSIAFTVWLKTADNVDASAVQDAVRRRVYARLKKEAIALPGPAIVRRP